MRILLQVASTQVLCAHVFGVTLLHEGESVVGLLGSAAIAAGVVTVNSANIGAAAKSGPARPYETTAEASLPQYIAVSMDLGPSDDTEACLGLEQQETRSHSRGWLAAAAEKLRSMGMRQGTQEAEADERKRAPQEPQLAGLLAERSAAGRFAGAGDSAKEPSGPAGSLGSRLSGQAAEVTPLGSPRLRRSSIELRRMGLIADQQRQNSVQASELPGSQGSCMQEQPAAAKRAVAVSMSQKGQGRGQTLRDREPSFGTWQFQRPDSGG